MKRSCFRLLTSLSLMASCFGVSAYAAEAPFDAGPTQNLNLAFGRSLPANLKRTAVVDSRGPSREAGGETIHVHFSSPRKINSVKLSDFSRSGKGQTLIHDVEAVTRGDDGNTQFALGELFDFNLKGAGLYDDRDGRVFLNPNGYVSTSVGKVLDSLSFQVEGFDNDDATLFIEIAADQPFNYYDFKVQRSGAENGGGSSPTPTPPRNLCFGNPTGSSVPPATQGLKLGYYTCSSSYHMQFDYEYAMAVRIESVHSNQVTGMVVVNHYGDPQWGEAIVSSCEPGTNHCSYVDQTSNPGWNQSYDWTIVDDTDFIFQFKSTATSMEPRTGSGQCTWQCY